MENIESIKFYDYTNQHFFANSFRPMKTWKDVVETLNTIDDVRANFTPNNDDYHLQIRAKRGNLKQTP